MSKNIKKKTPVAPELNEEKIDDEKLEQISGGHIEIVEDDSENSTDKPMKINGLTSNGNGHWA